MFIIKSETTLEIMIHDQLKYDIIYPALFLFQMQYKLKIRSLALLGSTYTTFNLANTDPFHHWHHLQVKLGIHGMLNITIWISTHGFALSLPSQNMHYFTSI
jgi:hypothetical protein